MTLVYFLAGCTGSLRYMAPEVALKEPYNQSVDLYGFGLIMYEIITGLVPFNLYTKEMFYQKIVHGRERPGLEYDCFGRAIKAQKTVTELIGRCWSASIADRPSAEEALAVLTEVENNARRAETKRNFLVRAVHKMLRKRDPV